MQLLSAGIEYIEGNDTGGTILTFGAWGSSSILTLLLLLKAETNYLKNACAAKAFVFSREIQDYNCSRPAWAGLGATRGGGRGWNWMGFKVLSAQTILVFCGYLLHYFNTSKQ